jgi:predicted transcriptional regulator
MIGLLTSMATTIRHALAGEASTIGRMLGEVEDRCWIERGEHRYEATPLGAFVADGLIALLERMETERTRREGWQWLPTEVIGFNGSV